MGEGRGGAGNASSSAVGREFGNAFGGISGRPGHVLLVVPEGAHTREERRERAERDAVARGEVAIRAFDPAGSGRHARRPVAVGMVALELTEPAADAAVLFDVGAEAVSRRMGHHDLLREVLVVAGVVDPVAELLVAAGLEAVIEQTHVLEDGSSDEQTAGRGSVCFSNYCSVRFGTSMI